MLQCVFELKDRLKLNKHIAEIDNAIVLVEMYSLFLVESQPPRAILAAHPDTAVAVDDAMKRDALLALAVGGSQDRSDALCRHLAAAGPARERAVRRHAPGGYRERKLDEPLTEGLRPRFFHLVELFRKQRHTIIVHQIHH